MSRIAWDVPGTRFFEAGVDRGVLYIGTDPGVPWIGLTSVDEKVVGGEATPYYIDGEKYLNISAVEEFEATITAYTYPVEFSQCDGSARIREGLFFGQQPRKSFGFSYRTLVGNDLEGVGHGYKIHLVYDALATPSSKTANTVAATTEASDFVWNLSTKARRVSGYKPTAHVTVDSRYTLPEHLEDIEDILYGSGAGVARLPTANELITIFDTPILWTVIDNGDGTFFVGGPEENVADIGNDRYQLTHPDVAIVDADTFTIDY